MKKRTSQPVINENKGDKVKYCAECGEQIGVNTNYCSNCGYYTKDK